MMDLVAVSGGRNHAAVKALLCLNSEPSSFVSGKHSLVCVCSPSLAVLSASACMLLVPV